MNKDLIIQKLKELLAHVETKPTHYSIKYYNELKRLESELQSLEQDESKGEEQPERTAEEILDTTIKNYNKTVSQVYWFAFNSSERKMFIEMMNNYAAQFRHPQQKTGEEIFAELDRAKKKHPNFPKDMFRQLAIMQEEAGEVTKAVLHYHYENGTLEHVKEELIQTGAMCVRMLENLPDFAQSSGEREIEKTNQ